MPATQLTIGGYCAELLPDGAKPKDDKDEPGDQGRGPRQEQGQGGPPASTGSGTQGERAPGARSAR